MANEKISEYLNTRNTFVDGDLFDVSAFLNPGYESQKTSWLIFKTNLTAAGFLSSVDLGYTASTRTVTNTGGADTVLPLFTDTEAGLVPLSGGGTTNFLRADGTWATVAGSDSIYTASGTVFAGAVATMADTVGLEFKAFNTTPTATILKASNSTGTTDVLTLQNQGLTIDGFISIDGGSTSVMRSTNDFWILNDTGLTAQNLYSGGIAIGANYGSISPPTNGLYSQGDVGIGVLVPTEKLDVAGRVKASTGFETGNNYIYSTNELQLLNSTGVLAQGSKMASLVIHNNYGPNTAPTNGAYILGDVGIGINPPTEKLDVAGNINTSGVYKVGGTSGLSATYTFGGGGSGDIATMTFTGGILTAITTVP